MLILNKVDLVTADDLNRVEKRLKTINKFAPIVRTERSAVSADSVLDIKGFDLKRTLEMDPEFLNTDGEHEHDASVTSVSIQQDGELDLSQVEEWVGELLREKGTDIYRMKGVLAIEHAEEKFVYQAVHMIFNGNFEEAWGKGEARESKLVFIGKNLDEKDLKAKFTACVSTPELKEKHRKQLRFGVGTKVQCKVGKSRGDAGWASGEVVTLMWRDESLPPGMVAPYQVKLDDGDLIYAGLDEDHLIRKA